MELFEKISKKFKKTDKTALILTGGGMTGWMYEIGALTALNDFFEDGFTVNEFDIFIGTSSGSSIASLLANKISPEEILDSILNNKPTPFNFKRKDIYSFAWKEVFLSIKKLTKSFSPILRYYFQNRNRFSILDLTYLLQENFPSGIFSILNLEKHLRKSFSLLRSSNDFRELDRELYIPAIDIDTGNFTVFGEGDNADVPVSMAVAASSAIPLLFQPVTIKGKDYVDGSVGRIAHINIAVNNGATFALIINPVIPINNDRKTICIPSFHGKCVGLREKGLSFIADQALRVNTETKLYLGMKRYRAEYSDIDFFLFQPPRTEVEMFSYNIMSLFAKAEVLNYGYFSTVRIIMKEFDELKKGFGKLGIKVSLDKFKKENSARWRTAEDVCREGKDVYHAK